MTENIKEFICTPKFQTFNSPDYKIYSVDVDFNKYPEIKPNKYQNTTILGDMFDLGYDIEYLVKAEEQMSKQGYGYQYKVINIKREKPRDSQSMKIFLSEILTSNQVNTLLEAYPDIVDRVINNRLDDIDLSKTYNIKEYTFNIIKNKIIENFGLVELVDEYQGMISISVLKKLFEKYLSIPKIKKELRDNPYKCLCGLSRIGFKTADSILLDVDKTSKDNISKNIKPIIDFGYDLKTSAQRCKACIMYLLEENETEGGHTKMSAVKLKKQCEKLAIACISHFVDIIKNDKDIYLDNKTKDVALKNTYDTEFYISMRIKDGLGYNTKWEFDVEKYKTVDNITLTDQQTDALKNICKYNISILNGFAGCGKSQTTNSIIRMLRDNKKSFKLFAPTGRASKVLSGFTNEIASTIHRGLGYMPPNEWGYNENDKLFCDVLIIDEFSMVDIFIMKKVLEAINFQTTKILIIGDSAQIPSVSAGNVLHDLVNSGLIPITTLTQVFRYGAGGLMTVATKTRFSEEFLTNDIKGVTFFGDDKGYIFIPSDQEKLVYNTISLYKKLLTKGYKPEDILVLSSYNKGDYGTVELNLRLQKIANPSCYGDGLKIGDTSYYVNDLVIQTVNNYKAPLYTDGFLDDSEDNETFVPNGEIGRIVRINKTNMIIDFDDKQIIYDKYMAAQLKLAYSISTHKSQGGQAKVVILLTPKAHTFMLNSNLIYVGQTRAKEKCYHIGSINTVNRAIKLKANFNRDTFLNELLKI